MKPSNKNSIPLTIAVFPYFVLLVYWIADFFSDALLFLLPTGLIILFPFSITALLLKNKWKINYEDGTGKGDGLTLLFGTLSFMGIVGGIAAWFYLYYRNT